jgi:hypothetical protein
VEKRRAPTFCTRSWLWLRGLSRRVAIFFEGNESEILLEVPAGEQAKDGEIRTTHFEL